MANNNENESFRDSLSTITKEGKRKWIYAKKPSGRYYRYRTYLSWFLLTVFFITPFIKVGGQPLIMLNFFERKFILFGAIFWPQDSYVLFLMMISFMLFIILFTVIYGRLWCGWTCPQTIFLEMLFRKIEYLIEGDAGKQIALKKQPLNFEKILKKGIKHLIFIILSVLIINTFIAYLVGIDKLRELISSGPSEHLTAFVVMLFFSFLFYLVFSWFREQVCIIACPYGRLQGVLLDSKSIVVSYDYKRGEPRGPFKKDENRQESGKGDCINCLQCVNVCPTGIDIRNGTQLECINCTACMDACDDMMVKHKMPRGLIRYASEESISKGTKFSFSWRMIAYSIVLTLLLSFLITLLATRKSVGVTILHTPGQLYQVVDDNKVSNLYNIRVINKSRKEAVVTLTAIEPAGEIRFLSQNSISVGKESSSESVFFVLLDKNKLAKGKNIIRISIYRDGKFVRNKKIVFMTPKQ